MNVPLESIHLLFEDTVVRGAMRDTFPGRARSKDLQVHSHVGGGEEAGRAAESGKVVAKQYLQSNVSVNDEGQTIRWNPLILLPDGRSTTSHSSTT